MTDYPQRIFVQGNVTSFKFWEMADNISETKQDRDIVAMED